MPRCPRCDRYHSGVCGIPRMAARIGRTRQVTDSSFDMQPFTPEGKRRTIRPSINNIVQAEVIAQAQSREKELQEILRGIPFDLPVYGTVMDRLDKVQRIIEVLQKETVR